MEKWEKNHHSGENSRGGIGTEQSGTGTGTDCVLSTSTDTHCSILTSVRNLAIT